MIADLQTIIDTLSCATYNSSQHSQALIKETDAKAALKKVTILAPEGDWFVFDPDRGRGKTKPRMSPLLSVGSSVDHHRACDAVVVVKHGDELRLIYIELKSSTAPSGYIGQFQSTRQFARYLLGLVDEFHEKKHKFSERFVVLHLPPAGKTLINKQKTAPAQRSGSSDAKKPRKMLVRNDAKLFLKDLLQ